MKVLFRALILLAVLFLVLGLIKWLFVKLLFAAFWVAVVAFVVFIMYSILKPAA